jgi:hypothetical protein
MMGNPITLRIAMGTIFIVIAIIACVAIYFQRPLIDTDGFTDLQVGISSTMGPALTDVGTPFENDTKRGGALDTPNLFEPGNTDLNGNCGTDARNPDKPFATCKSPYRCVNGYCKSDSPIPLPAITPLPIRPRRFTSCPTD